MIKTKLVHGKSLTAKAFAKVDDPNNPDTWGYPMDDEQSTRASLMELAKKHMDAGDRAQVAKKLFIAAKKFGIPNDWVGIEEVKNVVQKQLAVAEAGLSFDDIKCELQDSLLEKFGTDASQSPAYVLVQTYPDYLIARGPGGKLWKLAYTLDQQGEAQLGAPQQVEAGFVPLEETAATMVGEAAAIAWTARILLTTENRTGMRITMDRRDKIQLAMDGMIGVSEARSSGIKPFRGIQEAYMNCTGDTELSLLGKGGFQRVTESIATTDFPNILLDSLEKKLIQDYEEIGLNGMEQLITEGPPLKDYRTQNRVREGYMGDLPIVSEGGPYTELNKPTDEKITYTAQKRGGVLTISEETIRADDLNKIKDFPNRMARAARHTLKTFLTNFFVNNPNYGADGISWFNVAHNNLGSSPLNIDALIAQEVILMKQTEKDSGNKLARRISWLMVPVDLGPVAWQINNAQYYNPGVGIQQPNPFYLRFGPAGTGRMSPPGIIINEVLTDANDWYYGADNTQVPILEVGYMDGNPNPEIVLADLATQGTQFTNDQVQYKVKFPFGGTMLDFRGVGKNVQP